MVNLKGKNQMAFGEFKNLKQVLQLYPLKMRTEKFLPDVQLEVPEYLRENLEFSLYWQGTAYQSEAFFCESFIFPLLQMAWKRHKQLALWSHQSLVYDTKLFGEPDYLVSVWRDEAISEFVNTPLLAVAEAKRQDFDSGWGQCLAEMIACQKLNQNDNLTIYGIVSTGILWEFGKLETNIFTKHLLSYAISEPQKILGLLDYLFAECEKQAVQ
jgi:hypothetical protein